MKLSRTRYPSPIPLPILFAAAAVWVLTIIENRREQRRLERQQAATFASIHHPLATPYLGRGNLQVTQRLPERYR